MASAKKDILFGTPHINIFARKGLQIIPTLSDSMIPKISAGISLDLKLDYRESNEDPA